MTKLRLIALTLLSIMLPTSVLCGCENGVQSSTASNSTSNSASSTDSDMFYSVSDAWKYTSSVDYTVGNTSSYPEIELGSPLSIEPAGDTPEEYIPTLLDRYNRLIEFLSGGYWQYVDKSESLFFAKDYYRLRPPEEFDFPRYYYEPERINAVGYYSIIEEYIGRSFSTMYTTISSHWIADKYIAYALKYEDYYAISDPTADLVVYHNALYARKPTKVNNEVYDTSSYTVIEKSEYFPTGSTGHPYYRILIDIPVYGKKEQKQIRTDTILFTGKSIKAIIKDNKSSTEAASLEQIKNDIEEALSVYCGIEDMCYSSTDYSKLTRSLDKQGKVRLIEAASLTDSCTVSSYSELINAVRQTAIESFVSSYFGPCRYLLRLPENLTFTSEAGKTISDYSVILSRLERDEPLWSAVPILYEYKEKLFYSYPPDSSSNGYLIFDPDSYEITKMTNNIIHVKVNQLCFCSPTDDQQTRTICFIRENGKFKIYDI